MMVYINYKIYQLTYHFTFFEIFANIIIVILNKYITYFI